MPDTNIVFVDVEERLGTRFADFLQSRGVGALGYGRQRWVTHLDVSDDDVDGALAEVAAFFRAGAEAAFSR